MTDALRAHMRLLAVLPVRTVSSRVARYPDSKMGGRSKRETEHLHQRILALHEQGHKRREIADALNVSLPTVGKHLNGRIRSCK
jgi:DNA-binding NarL/FixJ family response regulator